MGRKIGVFGGTFDPIHIGHLVIASDICDALGLDEVRFLVAPRPPHKAGTIAADGDRIAMVRLAIAPDARFVLDLREFTRNGPSYSVETLQSFHEESATDRLYFIMGEDSLSDFPTWREPARILELATLAVAARPGVEINLSRFYERLPTARDRVVMVETPELAISSTLIRERLSVGRSIQYLVPDPVERYIGGHHLYVISNGA